jgi:L-alanine-DL-glutamate epimerase-like enolase superfamily enzyme
MTEIARVDIYHFRAPIKEPILTSFGAIVARNNVLLRVEDQDGAHGWGEIWASFRHAVPKTRFACWRVSCCQRRWDAAIRTRPRPGAT